ncbi:MAG TPA: ABC transporter substrate-binding protein [bacterium]|nr:ABC transporter substrate-binding protein [bacterium]
MTEDQMDVALQAIRGRVSRREFLRRAALLSMSAPAALALLERPRAAEAAGKVVNLAGYGGVSNDAIRKAWADPFEQKTGIKVNLGANASLALAKLQAQSGNPQWDIVGLDGSELPTAVKQGLLERIDTSKVDMSKVPGYLKTPYGFKYSVYLFTKAYDQRKIPDSSAPQNWKDFWDTGRYPMKRSIYQNVADGSILEAALMADGVPVSNVYPLDVERALKSLDRLGKANVIWHSANQQPIQQLTSGEVALATAFSGRVIVARRDGAHLQYTLDQDVASGSYFPVVKGSPNKEAAFAFLNFVATNDVAAATYMSILTYATGNASAVRLLPQEVADQLPTSPKLKGKILFKDDAWWADNLEKTVIRFKEWQAA